MNGLNQYTNISGAAVQHNNDGHLSRDEDGNSYFYNNEGRLTQVRRPNGSVLQSTDYYPDGTMQTRTGSERYVYSGDQEIVSYHDPGSLGGSNAVVQKRFIRLPGLSDQAFLMVDEAAGGTQHYAYMDERGSVIATANAGGTLQDVYTYDEFGNPGGPTGATSFPFRYTGQRWEWRTGLYYYKARHYDPKNGRFIQADPIGYADG